jgi:spore coat polysaccharide biosynthesis protein SpsF
MRTGAIIFSRMTSSRLPGKAFADINGKSLIERVFSRTKEIKLIDHICIATSKHSEDDSIASFAINNGINLYRGSLNNVLERAVNASIKFKYDNILRVCGDRPFLDASLYDKMIYKHIHENSDLTTNIFPRSVPAGLTGEIIKLETLKEINENVTDPVDKEHVTRYIYNNSLKFKIYNYNCNYSHEIKSLRLVVDDSNDLKRARWICKRLEENKMLNNETKQIISLALEFEKKIKK